MLLCTTSHAFMQARQQADFSEGGFAKLVPFFFFFLFFLNIYIFFSFPPIGSQGWFHIPMGWCGVTMGSSAGARPASIGQPMLVIW